MVLLSHFYKVPDKVAMSINIILNSDIILDLLSRSINDTQRAFARLQKSPTRFWIPNCLLPLLETQIDAHAHQPLDTLLAEAQLLSSLAIHWREIPATVPNRTHALISLDAAVLPGQTIIWTNDDSFTSSHASIEAGDHEFVYGILAEYGDDADNVAGVDLVSQQLRLRLPLEERLFNVLKHGQYILGPEVKILESQLAAYIGIKHCITVASGTDALLVALLAVGVKAGDEVITTPFGFSAAAEVVALLGAKPVFVDIESQTYTLNPDLLETAMTPKTKAIIPVNMYGQCAGFDAINQMAKKRHIAVIEEATHSFGATYKERFSCALSTIGCTSFFPTRPLGAYGDGGACFTNDDTLAEMLQQLRTHGQSKPYYHRLIGTNSRLDTLQASLLLTKFAIFPQELEERTRIATLYTRLLEGKVKTPVVLPHNTSVYAQYTIEVPERDRLREKLLTHGIESGVYYPIPLHLQPAFSYLGYGSGSFPVAEAAAQHVLSLPMHSYLTRDTQHRIARIITG